MRSLFFKIFIWFWVAMALIVLVHSLSAMMVFDSGAKGFVGGQLAMHGVAVAEIYELRGKDQANEYLKLLERNTRTRAGLFDDSGNRLAGSELTDDARASLQDAIATGNDSFRQTAKTDYLAKWLERPNAKRLIIVSESGRPTGVRLPFMPGIWYVQFIAVFFTAGALCYGLARYFTAPLVKLRQATRQLAAGNLSARVEAGNRRRDELADLGRDFDEMAERIQSLMDAQQRLLHDISHELRSPLTRLNIALELARESDGEEARWALERIAREADRLNDLINQLLTLSRLESRASSQANEAIDLKRLVEEIVFDADFEAHSRNRAVRLIAASDCAISGNQQLLHSAIENVVRNAVTYTTQDTVVEVALRCETTGENHTSSHAIITVLDKGQGVPQAALADIFRPFYRVADARDRESGGTGLGLSISQRAVEFHGGRVKATNAPNAGLLVEISLPLAKGAK
ncbi:MAG: ATP-binding protein [Acidobacteriota bacterium]